MKETYGRWLHRVYKEYGSTDIRVESMTKNGKTIGARAVSVITNKTISYWNNDDK